MSIFSLRAHLTPFWCGLCLYLSKMNFEPHMLDTLIRYRQKDSYSGSMANNPSNP
ncbi:hypothetical protein [Helicobacter felistomachi]|uniref:hypothetical protein n=1 Tax=Helicobacter felistomachi TaxID=3040201 RepID=UPI002573F446|nr:hypothetical protein [Helicobacter sp. NHP21005]